MLVLDLSVMMNSPAQTQLVYRWRTMKVQTQVAMDPTISPEQMKNMRSQLSGAVRPLKQQQHTSTQKSILCTKSTWQIVQNSFVTSTRLSVPTTLTSNSDCVSKPIGLSIPSMALHQFRSTKNAKRPNKTVQNVLLINRSKQDAMPQKNDKLFKLLLV